MRQPTFWQRFWCALWGGHVYRALLLHGDRPVVVECIACRYRRGGAS